MTVTTFHCSVKQAVGLCFTLLQELLRDINCHQVNIVFLHWLHKTCAEIIGCSQNAKLKIYDVLDTTLNM